MAKFGPYRAGQSWITVAIWANELQGQNGPYTAYSAKLSRTYRDRDGNWQVGNGGLRLSEIPVAVFALNQAYAKIMELETSRKS